MPTSASMATTATAVVDEARVYHALEALQTTTRKLKGFVMMPFHSAEAPTEAVATPPPLPSPLSSLGPAAPTEFAGTPQAARLRSSVSSVSASSVSWDTIVLAGGAHQPSSSPSPPPSSTPPTCSSTGECGGLAKDDVATTMMVMMTEEKKEEAIMESHYLFLPTHVLANNEAARATRDAYAHEIGTRIADLHDTGALLHRSTNDDASVAVDAAFAVVAEMRACASLLSEVLWCVESLAKPALRPSRRCESPEDALEEGGNFATLDEALKWRAELALVSSGGDGGVEEGDNGSLLGVVRGEQGQALAADLARRLSWAIAIHTRQTGCSAPPPTPTNYHSEEESEEEEGDGDGDDDDDDDDDDFPDSASLPASSDDGSFDDNYEKYDDDDDNDDSGTETASLPPSPSPRRTLAW